MSATTGSRIRISCAALCRIKIDGKYLLEINKNRGNELTPIGGSLEFLEEFDPQQEFDAWLEKGRDLRLSIPRDKLKEFEDWFRRREEKERELSPVRELREELVEEHKILKELKTSLGENLTPYRTAYQLQATTKKEKQGEMTHYFIEYFVVALHEDDEKAIKEQIHNFPRLFLLSEEEVLAESATVELPDGTQKTYKVADTVRRMVAERLDDITGAMELQPNAKNGADEKK